MPRGLILTICCATGCYSGLGDGERLPPDGPPSAEDGGGDGDDGGEGDDGAAPGRDVDEIPELATRSGLRRLTVAEYDNVLADLIGDDTEPAGEFLPADALTPFDNDYEGQSPSEALVLGAERLANEAADRLLADPERLSSLLSCAPEVDGEQACLEQFITRFGRRAFRRPLHADEVAAFTGLSAVGDSTGDWNVSIAAVVREMLQDPNFLYRVEIGVPVDGAPDIMRLTDYEMASRLSFFLWSTMPDDTLLDAAADDALSTPTGIHAQAERMIADTRARETITRFHAQWLGYSGMGDEGIPGDMLDESRALIERVVFGDDGPWLSLLTSTSTYVTPQLAEHYGLTPPDGGQAGWVDYGDSGRGGILSQGTLLSLGAKFEDTSPTVRGVELRTRLFCQTIELSDDVEVNTDDPPGFDPDDCKWDRYADHREVAACAGCHALTDGLGFGLENYDASGVFREHDVGKPECVINGDGEVAGVSEFNGPAELGEILAETPAVRSCAIQQLYRFATGRNTPDELDIAYMLSLQSGLGDEELHLTDLLVDIVGSEAFRFRVMEGE